MDADSRISLIFIFVLLLLAAVFAISETAFASASQSKIKVSADRGDDRAERALDILENIETAISTLLICTTIVHLTIATAVTVMVTRLWGLSVVSISTIITTLVVFFAGEMLPKSIAKKNPEKFALRTLGYYLYQAFRDILSHLVVKIHELQIVNAYSNFFSLYTIYLLYSNP